MDAEHLNTAGRKSGGTAAPGVRSGTGRTRTAGLLMTAKAAAAFAGLPYTTFRSIAQRGEIPIVRVGRVWYVRRADVETWIDRNLERLA